MGDENNGDDVIPEERFTPDSKNEKSDNSNNGVPTNAPPLIINGQYIKDLSFEAPNTPDVFSLLQNEVPSIEVNVDVVANPKENSVFEVALTVRAEAKIKDQLVYLCEVEYAGLFTLNIPEDQLGPVLLIECPLIIFPFLRRIISDLTGDGGFAPLMLAPIDFAALYQQRMDAVQKEEVPKS